MLSKPKLSSLAFVNASLNAGPNGSQELTSGIVSVVIISLIKLPPPPLDDGEEGGGI